MKIIAVDTTISEWHPNGTEFNRAPHFDATKARDAVLAMSEREAIALYDLCQMTANHIASMDPRVADAIAKHHAQTA